MDLYAGLGANLSGPARLIQQVTPSDAVQLPIASTALWIGSAGNVSVIAVNDKTPITLACPAGTWLPIRAAFVLAAGTTAADIVALIG